MTTLGTSSSAKTQETATPWPLHGCLLMPGVNDTWNEFQKAWKGTGKLVNAQDWRAARAALHAQYQQFIADGGIPLQIEPETSRFSLQ